MSIISSLIGGPVKDALDKAQKGAPAAIDSTIAQISTGLASTIDKATALFNHLYSQAVAGIAAWLPTIKPWLLARIADVIAKAKVAVAKL